MNNNTLLKILSYIFIFSLLVFLFRLAGFFFYLIRVILIFIFTYWYITIPLILLVCFLQKNRKRISENKVKKEQYKKEKTIDITDYKIE